MKQKQWKKRRENSLSIENDGYYDNEISGTNLDYENSFNLKNNKNWKFSEYNCIS